MNASSIFTCLLCLIIGAAIGAGVTYNQVKCKTSGLNIQLNSSGSQPGISITKTGDEKQ